jgi:hypothetical protein
MSEIIPPRTAVAPRRPLRNRLAAGCLLVGVAAAAGFLSLPRLASGPPRPAAAAPRTRAIEALRVGDRVAAHNPEVDTQARRAPDPEPATWRRLTLRVDRPGVCRFEVELLRPLAWLEAEHAAAGGTVHLRLPEMGLDDPAAVLAVDPCPVLRPSPGRVVTGTFTHETEGNLLNVYVEGLAGPIGCTRAHLFWSEDRRRFVAAADLRTGERLRTADAGVRPVSVVEARPGREVVYNLEVDAEHAYFVSPLGVLVHNTSPTPPSENPPPSTSQPPGTPPRGVSLDEGVATGRVGSRLRAVLERLVQVFGENPPRSIEEGQLAARAAANRAGMASEGAPRADSPPGQLILDNNGGVTTTVMANGEIIVRAADGTVVLHLTH